MPLPNSPTTQKVNLFEAPFHPRCCLLSDEVIARFGVNIHKAVHLVEDTHNKYWYVSSTVMEGTLKIDETMVFRSNKNGEVLEEEFGKPVKTYLPSDHQRACEKFLNK